jgi:hypothetical protein
MHNLNCGKNIPNFCASSAIKKLMVDRDQGDHKSLLKIAQNVSPSPVCQNKCLTLTVEKIFPNFRASSAIKKYPEYVNSHPLGENWPILVTLPGLR